MFIQVQIILGWLLVSVFVCMFVASINGLAYLFSYLWRKRTNAKGKC